MRLPFWMRSLRMNQPQSRNERTHFGDPCIHCGIPHDEIPAGQCSGDPSKAIPVSYRSMGVRWDNTEEFLMRMSDGTQERRYFHIDELTELCPHHWHNGRCVFCGRKRP